MGLEVVLALFRLSVAVAIGCADMKEPQSRVYVTQDGRCGVAERRPDGATFLPGNEGGEHQSQQLP